MRSFEDVLAEASAQRFTGWDFSAIEDRVVREGTPWSYLDRVRELAASADSLVDLGTGGGEVLSEVTPRPRVLVATEGYMPNVPVAAARLRPLGIHVVAYEGSPDNIDQDRSTPQTLPFREASFDVVVDRHEAFNARDVARVLKSGGTFFTQQVGVRDCIELCEALGGVTPQPGPTVDEYIEQLASAGLNVRDARESFAAKAFLDSGALLSYVLAIPWAFVGFSLETHRDSLRKIHDRTQADGGFTTSEHRLLFEGVKP
jgi:SAM-dependent methyltransferase